MSENTAEKLDAPQAAELVRVIDLQARWENMRGNPVVGGGSGFSTPDLQARQKAYEAFRVRLAAYSTRYKASHVPEITLNTPERVGMWCRAVRAVLRRAGQEVVEYPAHTVAKAHRLADRIAVRLGRPPAEREESSPGLAGAIRNLDAIINWCELMAAPPILLSGLRIIPAVGVEVRSEAA